MEKDRNLQSTEVTEVRLRSPEIMEAIFSVRLGSQQASSRVFHIDRFHSFPLCSNKHLWAALTHLVHVQAFARIPGCNLTPSTGKHTTFSRSWHGTPSLTVLALKCCSSENLIQNLTHSTQEPTGLKTHENATFEAAECENLQGSASKAQACAGCLVEERRPLTANWPFPKLPNIPPLVGMVHAHSRFPGPANA